MSALDVVQRPARWLQAISRYRGTVSGAPPFAFRACLDRIRDDQLVGVDLSSWQVAFVGAERVPEELLRRFGERFAPHGLSPDAVRACYGLAEATLLVSIMSKPARQCAPSLASADGERSGVALASCGQCIPEHELICVDARGRVCPEGECGEIWVRGPSVAAGYYGRTAESERVFGARCEGRGPYLRTGDLGLLHDGQVFVVGRIKDIVIVRGRKFAPEDIEATVATSHAFVAGTIGAAFSLARQDGEVLVVVQEVTRSATREPDLEEARAAIREQLTTMHGISPAAIAFVAPGSVPRTTSGKVQRGRCRELFTQQKLALVQGTRAQAAGTRAPTPAVRGLGEA
jgi:acyl-CoA synthetase (AMP-forming)/AMP-acid ligase II